MPDKKTNKIYQSRKVKKVKNYVKNKQQTGKGKH